MRILTAQVHTGRAARARQGTLRHWDTLRNETLRRALHGFAGPEPPPTMRQASWSVPKSSTMPDFWPIQKLVSCQICGPEKLVTKIGESSCRVCYYVSVNLARAVRISGDGGQPGWQLVKKKKGLRGQA